MRLFVAVDLPAAIKDGASAMAERIHVAAPSARWVPRDNYHVTTKFLGHVAEERLEEISLATAHAASGMLSFDVRATGLGAFPSAKRARVLWLGLDDAAGGFAALQTACDEAFEPLGFEAERRAFVPHLTLARLKVPAPVTLPEISLDARFTVDRLTLFRSHLRRPAPTYEPLAVYPFGLG